MHTQCQWWGILTSQNKCSVESLMFGEPKLITENTWAVTSENPKLSQKMPTGGNLSTTKAGLLVQMVFTWLVYIVMTTVKETKIEFSYLKRLNVKAQHLICIPEVKMIEIVTHRTFGRALITRGGLSAETVGNHRIFRLFKHCPCSCTVQHSLLITSQILLGAKLLLFYCRLLHAWSVEK